MQSATPHFGMTPFVLGMTRRQLSAAVGDPSRVEHLTFGPGNAKESWEYPNHRVDVSFSEDHDWALSSVTIENPEATVRGVQFIGCPVGLLAALAASAGIDDVVRDGDYDESGSCYESDRFGLQFWAHQGRVARVTLFPRYDKGGNVPQWPEG